MGSVLKPIQTLKEYFSSHLLRSPWYPLVPLGTKLLEVPVQLLIGSPGTLIGGCGSGDPPGPGGFGIGSREKTFSPPCPLRAETYFVTKAISKIRFPHPIPVADAICGTRFDLRDSKRRALEHQSCVRICYMFLISKCRGD